MSTTTDVQWVVRASGLYSSPNGAAIPGYPGPDSTEIALDLVESAACLPACDDGVVSATDLALVADTPLNLHLNNAFDLIGAAAIATFYFVLFVNKSNVTVWLESTGVDANAAPWWSTSNVPDAGEPILLSPYGVFVWTHPGGIYRPISYVRLTAKSGPATVRQLIVGRSS